MSKIIKWAAFAAFCKVLRGPLHSFAEDPLGSNTCQLCNGNQLLKKSASSFNHQEQIRLCQVIRMMFLIQNYIVIIQGKTRENKRHPFPTRVSLKYALPWWTSHSNHRPSKFLSSLSIRPLLIERETGTKIFPNRKSYPQQITNPRWINMAFV